MTETVCFDFDQKKTQRAVKNGTTRGPVAKEPGGSARINGTWFDFRRGRRTQALKDIISSRTPRRRIKKVPVTLAAARLARTGLNKGIHIDVAWSAASRGPRSR